MGKEGCIRKKIKCFARKKKKNSYHKMIAWNNSSKISKIRWGYAYYRSTLKFLG